MRGPIGEPGAIGEAGPRGPAGEAPEPIDGLPLAVAGVVGSVRDPSGASVPGGRVYFVPASDVLELAKTPIDLSLSPDETQALANDEPLEDLLDAHAADYQSAVVGDDGGYRLEKLEDDKYFVVWQPADQDTAHYPGGSACRSALDYASLVGTRLDLRVSGRSSEQATYVGSSGCFGCHGRHRSMRTAHRVGLQVPGLRGALQDSSPWPALDQGIDAFEQSTTLYYYNCDPARTGEAKCLVRDSDPTIATPTAVVSFEVQLDRDTVVPRSEVGAYTVTLVNREGVGSVTYPVALTYGGVLSKQQYITRSQNPNGQYSYYVLPLQFNIAGLDSYPSSDDWVWKDYRSEQWYEISSATLAVPAKTEAFDNRCAGCHLTGMRLSGTAKDGLSAHAVGDGSGDFDYDGDGRREEINVGCESCHGPASEHLEAKTRGLRIVSPSLLTPEREMMLCGSCHSRPLGKAVGGSDAPLSETGAMPRPGLRRSEFAADFTSRVDGDPADFHTSGDSSANHAQYSDFIRSGMYRNGSTLMTCTSCHDAHGSDAQPHELLRAPDDNTACTGCHSGKQYTAPRGHVDKATAFVHDGTETASLTCTSCHMVRTAASGARHPELLDKIPSLPGVQYFHGDIASHRFAVPKRSSAAVQPVAATLKCGFCHSTNLPNP